MRDQCLAELLINSLSRNIFKKYGVLRGMVKYKVNSTLFVLQPTEHHLSPSTIITSGWIPAGSGQHLVLVWLEGCILGLEHPVPWQQRFSPNASVEKHHVCITSQACYTAKSLKLADINSILGQSNFAVFVIWDIQYQSSLYVPHIKHVL